MAAVEGLPKLMLTLQGLIDKAGKDAQQSVVVGYGAEYAGLVHEDLEMPHPNGGQAKFLEQPARLLADEMGKMVAKAVGEGKSVIEAEEEAGKFLLEQSRLLVPVDTGFLRDSGFVRVE